MNLSNPLKEGGHSCPPKWHFFNPRDETAIHHNRLPHWQQSTVYYFATWRLADSVPQDKLSQWTYEKEIWLSLHPKPWGTDITTEYHQRFSGKIDEWLDAGMGLCFLRRPEAAQIVAATLLHFDQQRYAIDQFIIMPNHVHVLFLKHSNYLLPAIIKSWKGFSARKINQQLGGTGQLWMDDYWDRIIRNDEHLQPCREYIRRNPEKAGLKVGEYIYYSKNGDKNVPAPN